MLLITKNYNSHESDLEKVGEDEAKLKEEPINEACM